MARTKPLPRADFARPEQPVESFTRDNVGPLAEELGLHDEQKILELKQRLNRVADWYQFGFSEDSLRLSLARDRLRGLKNDASKLLKAVDDLDHETKDWLAKGLRIMRGDPRTGHLHPNLRDKEWQMMGAVRSIVDLLHDAARHATEGTPKGDGRPSLRSVSQACLDLAQLYEDLSARKFTREKSRGVWTDSAHWVANVARMLPAKGMRQPSDKQLDTAMRYAVRDLGNGRTSSGRTKI